MNHLTERETAAVLAGLRLMQRQTVLCAAVEATATGCGKFEPLDDDEIDALCVRINMGEG